MPCRSQAASTSTPLRSITLKRFWTAAIGVTCCARPSISGEAPDNPMWRILPSSQRFVRQPPGHCRAAQSRIRSGDIVTPTSRLISRASAPEFGEPPGKGSALVVTGSSGGRTRRQIHQIAAECVAGVAVREDGFDSAAAGA
jgi:hypothetical protein